MKKFSCFVIILVFTLFLILCASGCKDGNGKKTIATIDAAYQQAKELGYNGTIDDFIILIKGDKGEKGEQGVGIIKVESNENGQLVIFLSDGSVHTIDIPEEHTYGEWFELTSNSDMTIYARICSKCGHFDLKYGESVHIKEDNFCVSVNVDEMLKVVENYGNAENGNQYINIGEKERTLAPVSSFNAIDFFFKNPQNIGYDGAIGGSYKKYTSYDLQFAYKYASTVFGYIDYKFTLHNNSEQEKVVIPSMTYKMLTENSSNITSALRSAIFVESNDVNDGLVKFIGAGSSEGKHANAIIDENGNSVEFKPISKNFTIPGHSNINIMIRVWIECEDSSMSMNIPDIGKYEYKAMFQCK